MSGKRSLPSPWASRGAIFAALAGVGMVLFAVVGAWMLFAPAGETPSTTRDEPSTESTEQSGDAAIEDEPTQEPTAPRTPRATVETVPPSAAPTPTAHPAAEDDPSAPDPAPTLSPRTRPPGTRPPRRRRPTPIRATATGNGNGQRERRTVRGQAPRLSRGRRFVRRTAAALRAGRAAKGWWARRPDDSTRSATARCSTANGW